MAGELRLLLHNHPGRIARRASLKWWQAQAKDHHVMMACEASHLGERRVGARGTVLDYLTAWDAFSAPFASTLGQTPILYRRHRFQLLEAAPRRHYPDTHVGSWGAGPPWMRAGYTNAAMLLDVRSRQPWWLLAGHWVPSVTQSRQAVLRDGPQTPQARAERLRSWEKRRELHRLETAGAAALMRELEAAHQGVPVILGGDTNAPASWDGMAQLRRISRPVYPGPTHGRRAIDGLWLAGRPVRVLDAKIIQGPLSDDHDAVSVTLRPAP